MSMKKMEIRDIVVGEGWPKICVPITAPDKEEAVRQAALIDSLPCDMMEFRADHLRNNAWKDIDILADITDAMRRVTEKPIIFTLRTTDEGGLAEIQRTMYYSLIRDLAGELNVDVFDVEPFDDDSEFNDEKIRFIVGCIHSYHKKVILSHHNFHSTPSVDVMVRWLFIMQELGADLPKIAVMPKNEQDVTNLLMAAATMRDRYAKTPFIALSMGELGMSSRVCGATVGSAVTFASGGEKLGLKASAPGQVDVYMLRDYMQEYYDAQK